MPAPERPPERTPTVLKPELDSGSTPTRAAPEQGAKPLRLPLIQATERQFLTAPEAVSRLLNAAPQPDPLVHTASRRLALLFREGNLPLARMTRPSLGLAGQLIDPSNHTPHARAHILRIDVLGLDTPDDITRLLPPDGALLEAPAFSPDGRYLSAAAVWPDRAALVVYDLEGRSEQLVQASLNLLWGPPCQWEGSKRLLCRVVPPDRHQVILEEPAPTITEHLTGLAPARTYQNLLQNANDDRLFEHYFGSVLVTVTLDGISTDLGARGLFPQFDTSPDGRYLLTSELRPPYSRFVTADRFPRAIQIRDRQSGDVLFELLPPEDGTRGYPIGPREPQWDPAASATLLFVDAVRLPVGRRDRINAWAAPFTEPAAPLVEVVPHVTAFGRTSTGRLHFTRTALGRAGAKTFVVSGNRQIALFDGAAPGLSTQRPLRVDGDRGPILERAVNDESGAWFFSRGDADSSSGLYTHGYGTAPSGHTQQGPRNVHQRVRAVTDLEANEILVTRETLATPPNYFLLRGSRAMKLTDLKSSYTELAGTRRRKLTYTRSDGVRLDAMLYLPPGYEAGERLPTVFWIYPNEYSDERSVPVAETQRFWNIHGASPFALLLSGYALVDHPSMPIIGVPGRQNDSYLPQLIASAEAAVDHVVSTGVAHPDRLAVAGRSYGAFSAANLLVHTDLFRTAIAMSGAYNRTLTPFGFQSEQRSFWQATELYARISPFFHAHQFKRPILLVHGAVDTNPGTLPMQSERFFQALAGNGAPVRYVSLPFEGHQYRARESVDHVVQEMLNWLERHLSVRTSAHELGP